MNTAVFKEFLSLLNACYQLDNDTLVTIETMYQTLYQDKERFTQLLVDKLNYDVKEAEYLTEQPDEIETSAHHAYLIQIVLEGFFPCYFDDWKFYCEDLSDYISEYTDTPFVITSEEYAGDMDNLYRKLESETKFSLLHIWSGNDDVHFYLINKADKPRLLELSEQFDIWID
jgi:hypothetical protein